MKKLIVGVLMVVGILTAAVLTVRPLMMRRGPKQVSRSSQPAVWVSLRGTKTNSDAIVCQVLAITNGTDRPYFVAGFATETKPVSGWAKPDPFVPFKPVSANGHLAPASEREFLVPTITSAVPWRVTMAFTQETVPGYRNPDYRMYLLATPEIGPTRL